MGSRSIERMIQEIDQEEEEKVKDLDKKVISQNKNEKHNEFRISQEERKMAPNAQY